MSWVWKHAKDENMLSLKVEVEQAQILPARELSSWGDHVQMACWAKLS